MITLIYFLYLQIQPEVNADVGMYYSYPGVNLFFIHPGFANPSLVHGPLGFSLNPAGLVSSYGSELMITLGPAIKTSILTEFKIPIDSITPILDTISIPTRLGFEQTGGGDFLGFSFKLKSWHFGIGIQKGDYLGLDFNTNATVSANYEFEYLDTLTSEDIGGIPMDDSIPVNILFDGNGSISLIGNGNGFYKSWSLIFAAAHRFIGLDLGLGAQITPVKIEGGFDALFNGKILGGSGVSIVPLDDWTIDATFNLEVDADSIIGCRGNVLTEFYLSTFYWGIKKEWRYLSLGLCGEFSPPVFIKGNWQFITSIPNKLPKFRFEDNNLVVDTINKIITGSAKMVVYDFEKRDSTYGGDIKTLFLSSNGITGGLAIRFWRFETGIFGGLNFSEDGTYLKIRAGINLGFKTFIPLRLGAILHFQYFNIGGLPVSALPVIAFGGGTDFNIKKMKLFLNLSGNTTQGAAALVIPGIVGGQEETSAIIALGLGLSYKF